MPKKASKIKSKTSTKVLKSPAKTAAKGSAMLHLKTVKNIATGIVKAMGAKAAKKAQTKAPAKKESKELKAAPQAKAEKHVKPGKKDLKPHAPAPKVTEKTEKTEKTVAKALMTKAPKGAGAKSSGAKSAQNLANHERMCRESGCENVATTKGYCRLDYIKNWKKIKRKEMILKEGKLNQYIEELVSKYPDKYIEVIRQDLSTEVNFSKVIHDLELDESIDDMEYDGDSIDSLIGSIRKEDDGFDDTEF